LAIAPASIPPTRTIPSEGAIIASTSVPKKRPRPCRQNLRLGEDLSHHLRDLDDNEEGAVGDASSEIREKIARPAKVLQGSIHQGRQHRRCLVTDGPFSAAAILAHPGGASSARTCRRVALSAFKDDGQGSQVGPECRASSSTTTTTSRRDVLIVIRERFRDAVMGSRERP